MSLTIICVLDVLGVSYLCAQSPKEFKVIEQEISDKKNVPATVDSVHKTYARSRISGTVDGLSITEGQHLEAGTIMATIADPKQPLDIAALDAKVKGLENELSLANIQQNRLEALKKTGVASQSSLDKARTDVNVMENNIKSLKAERDRLMANKGEGRVLAPLSGRVLKILITNGSVVLPGDMIAELAVEGLILRLSVPESHVSFLSQDLEVEIIDPTGVEPKNQGEIKKIYPLIEQGRVIVDVSAPQLSKDAPIGKMYIVSIPASKRKSIIIPMSFVRERYGISYVSLKGGNDVIIQPGMQDGDSIEIMSGLMSGDILVEPAQ